MRETSGQRSLTLRAPATSAGCRGSPWFATFACAETSGRVSASVIFAGSTMVGRPLEERSSESDWDETSGSSSSGCVGGGSGKSSSA
eukprot:1406143-Pleurochrysis_carterae.AAC.1